MISSMSFASGYGLGKGYLSGALLPEVFAEAVAAAFISPSSLTDAYKLLVNKAGSEISDFFGFVALKALTKL